VFEVASWALPSGTLASTGPRFLDVRFSDARFLDAVGFTAEVFGSRVFGSRVSGSRGVGNAGLLVGGVWVVTLRVPWRLAFSVGERYRF